MAIKNKNKNPKTSDFAANDLVINSKEGTLFFKSDSSLVKLQPLGGINDDTIEEVYKHDIGISLDGTTGYKIGSNFIIHPSHREDVPIGGGSSDTSGWDGSTDVTLSSGKTLDVSSGTLTTSTAQKQAIVQAGPGSGTIDVSSGTLTTSTAQKKAIIDSAGHIEVLHSDDEYAHGYPRNYYSDNSLGVANDWQGPRRRGNGWWVNYGDNTQVLSLNRKYAGSGIIVPFACECIGFQAVLSLNENQPGTLGALGFALYKGDFSYADNSEAPSAFNITSGTSENLTLVQLCEAVSGVPGEVSNPMTLSVTNQTDALSAGDMIYPRLKYNFSNYTSSNQNKNIYVSYNILIKRV